MTGLKTNSKYSYVSVLDKAVVVLCWSWPWTVLRIWKIAVLRPKWSQNRNF